MAWDFIDRAVDSFHWSLVQPLVLRCEGRHLVQLRLLDYESRKQIARRPRRAEALFLMTPPQPAARVPSPCYFTGSKGFG